MNPVNTLSSQDRMLRLLVLSAIADDYEDFRIIAHETSAWAREVGLVVNHEKILGALAELIDEGLAKAYVLSSREPYVVPTNFSRERARILWYWITPDGKRLLETLQTELGSPARSEEASAYYGFEILGDVTVEGFRLGKITDFEAEPTETGDAFIVAPDGSRAGLVWEVSSENYFEEVMGKSGSWGVWAVSFPHPMTSPDNIRRNLESILPELKKEWEKWRLQCDRSRLES